jgi:hypothetical protein
MSITKIDKNLKIEIHNDGQIIFFHTKTGKVCVVNLHPSDNTSLVHFLVDECDYTFKN